MPRPVRSSLLLAAAPAIFGFVASVSACAGPNQAPPVTPRADQASLVAFYEAGAYKTWTSDVSIRRTGPFVDGVDYSTHGNVRVYYSPEIVDWLRKGRPVGGIPDGAVIFKVQFPTAPDAPNKDVPTSFAAMVRQKDLSYDGWFWSVYSPEGINRGEAFIPWCVGCHASAEREQTFATLRNIEGEPLTYEGEGPPPRALTTSHDTQGPSDAEKKAARLAALRDPRTTPDPAFLALFPQWPVPDRAAVRAFPDNSADHIPPSTDADRFVTSSICGGCHDANLLLDNATPSMMVQDSDGTPLNLSPYGEWSASLMGLAGRDPVFHAQLESEKSMRPKVAAALDDTCYRCHGVMGQRQLHADGTRRFEHFMVYATPGQPDALYGSLARDGVSCVVCHRAAEEGLGTSATFTGQFNTVSGQTIFGPFDNPLTFPMKQALGATPQKADHLASSALCGSCHTVILPQLPADDSYAGTDPFTDPAVKQGHEQTTYPEWRNSVYQNERAPISAEARTCQQCHMPQYRPEDTAKRPLSFRIANIEDAGYPAVDNRAPDAEIALQDRSPYSRHTLVGLNLFVMSMFQQFLPILGVQKSDINVPGDTASSLTLAAEESTRLAREQSARVEIVDVRRTSAYLETRVRVTNLAGHKLPSGVGFRRAFVEFLALDAAGTPLWTSGMTSPLGVLLDGAGAPLATEFADRSWQPHHEIITREDEAQIYESRHLDTAGRLTTSFVGLAEEVKDNRLLPKGWSSTAPDTDFMQPIGVDKDRRYRDGSGMDEIVYRVPAARAGAVATVVARLHYQAIPPYYLKDRFTIGRGDETRRLYYLASHLDVAGTPIEGWRLTLGEARRSIPSR